VLVVVGGPQYRVGSHRQFVQLGRELAQAGWPVFRFDVRGMGDSTGTFQGFERLAPDIGAAVDAFYATVPGLKRVVLWGLCDGASAALLYLERADPRVGGLVLLNPWVRSAHTLAQAQVSGYYARRAIDPATWRALLRGAISVGSLLDFARALIRAALAVCTCARRGRPPSRRAWRAAGRGMRCRRCWC
jgi:exosortase A-associated hydrolase 1